MAEKKEYHFWVYIAASRSHQTYIGVRNSLERRMKEHIAAPEGSHTARYRINRLVYFEHYKYIRDAVAREKELKDWNQSRKIALIEAVNPTWQDLFEDLGESLRRFSGMRAGPRDGVALPTADSSASLRNDNRERRPGQGRGVL